MTTPRINVEVFFARVLVNIDMLSILPNQILVERLDFTFIADIEFEKLPLFFPSCKMIGHDISKCKQKLNTHNNIVKLPSIFP